MKRVIKFTLVVIILIVVLFVGFLGWQTLYEFNPPDEETIAESSNPDNVPDTLTLVTWNVGYFGLGEDMDFFYEGGKMVKPKKEQYLKYKEKILAQLKSFDTAAFILLQEVDSIARRSFKDNQLSHIRETVPHKLFFGMNYDAWVPVPITNPMGKVKAGIATLTQFTPISARKVYFGTSYEWPKSLFMLKRCFIETRFKTRNGNELVLVNTHNSAFDDAAHLREEELGKLKQLMLGEYKKGNYVIVGGDWNLNPPTYDTIDILDNYRPKYIKPSITDDYLEEGWIYAFDKLHTTNREVNMPYYEGITGSSLIDFFILSPNIKLQSVKVIPTGFKESDHQPVVLKIIL